MYLVTIAIVEFISHDCHMTDLIPIWDSMTTQLEGYSATLSQLTNQIADMRKEAETYLRLADELIETSADMGKQFFQYYHTL